MPTGKLFYFIAIFIISTPIFAGQKQSQPLSAEEIVEAMHAEKNFWKDKGDTIRFIVNEMRRQYPYLDREMVIVCGVQDVVINQIGDKNMLFYRFYRNLCAQGISFIFLTAHPIQKTKLEELGYNEVKEFLSPTERTDLENPIAWKLRQWLRIIATYHPIAIVDAHTSCMLQPPGCYKIFVPQSLAGYLQWQRNSK